MEPFSHWRVGSRHPTPDQESFMNREHDKQQRDPKQGDQQHQQGNPAPRPGQDQQGGGTRNPGQQQQQNPNVNDESKDRPAPAK
jgi:hypothetical protein